MLLICIIYIHPSAFHGLIDHYLMQFIVINTHIPSIIAFYRLRRHLSFRRMAACTMRSQLIYIPLHLYHKYCRDSIIDSQMKLYRLFHYLKQYPVTRAHELKSVSSIHKYITHLASVINELSSVWNRRHEMTNRIPHHFRDMLTGSIDTFPVVVSRPVDNTVQSYLYNGKYKKHVMKVLNSFS